MSYYTADKIICLESRGGPWYMFFYLENEKTSKSISIHLVSCIGRLEQSIISGIKRWFLRMCASFVWVALKMSIISSFVVHSPLRNGIILHSCAEFNWCGLAQCWSWLRVGCLDTLLWKVVFIGIVAWWLLWSIWLQQNYWVFNNRKIITYCSGD